MARIKKNDKVQVIAGKDKGKTGKVTAVMPKQDKVLVEGINVVKRHMRGSGSNPGEIVEKSLPLHISNVMVVDPKTNKPTRIGIKEENGRRLRVTKQSNSTLK